MNKPTPISSRERVARRRAAQRAQGLRPKQIWVPDVRTPAFREEANRQARAVARASTRTDDLAFAEAAQYWPVGDED